MRQNGFDLKHEPVISGHVKQSRARLGRKVTLLGVLIGAEFGLLIVALSCALIGSYFLSVRQVNKFLEAGK